LKAREDCNSRKILEKERHALKGLFPVYFITGKYLPEELQNG
jgi:hypothetical protein